MYWFRVPSLPKEEYEYLKMVKKSTGLSDWQVVILAFRCLRWAASEHGGTVEEMVAKLPGGRA